MIINNDYKIKFKDEEDIYTMNGKYVGSNLFCNDKYIELQVGGRLVEILESSVIEIM